MSGDAPHGAASHPATALGAAAHGAATHGIPLLEAAALDIAAGGRRLVAGLALQLQPGEFLAVLGRNGTGKSLTLRTLAGLRPAGGELRLGGAPMAQLTRRAIARQLGYLAQDAEEALAPSAREAALLARHPHLGWWQRESAEDERLVMAALARFGVAECAARPLATLSGGEQRRVALASLLAQAPRVYLLDEPSNHLDPHHQVAVLDAFRERCAAGDAVVATLHDPGLAARCADRLLLLHGDGRWQLGSAAELLTPGTLGELYGTPMLALGSGARRAFIPA
jgi:iron complex transport system ATP-binding protein